jgi:Tubulin-tyrosine ligase family
MDFSSKKALTNKFMHLTNNAIQELGHNYSIHEKGNIISIPEFEKIKNDEGSAVDFGRQVWPQIREAVRISTLSCAHLLNPNKRMYSYEIYGYDFMIDSNCKTWMIEINTNPSLTESNQTVTDIIMRMMGS